jgi:hypothetical protein
MPINLFKKKSKKDKNKDKLESDAVVVQEPRNPGQQINGENGALAVPNTEVVPSAGAGSVAINNNMVQQTQNTTNIVIQHAKDVHIGPKIIFKPPTKSPAKRKPSPQEVQTIKLLCTSKDKITPRFMDLVASNLGKSWERLVKDVLKLHQPDIEYIVLDFQHQGFKEVAFENLKKFFQENEDPEKNTVGWLINTMWKNDFRVQVKYIKDKYKTIDWSVPEVPEVTASEGIKELMDSEEELDDLTLDLIAQSLGKKYKFLGDLLNIDQPTLGYLEEDFVNLGHKEVIFIHICSLITLTLIRLPSYQSDEILQFFIRLFEPTIA